MVLLVSLSTQSCLIYKRPHVALEVATDSNDVQYKKVKTVAGNVFHMKRLEVRDGQVYGSYVYKGELKKLGFLAEDIRSIRLQNKQLSGLGNVFLAVVLLSTVGFLWYQQEMKDFDCCGLQFPM